MNDEHVQRAAHALRSYVALLDTGTAAETALVASGLVEENNRLRAALKEADRWAWEPTRLSQRERLEEIHVLVSAALSSPASEEPAEDGPCSYCGGVGCVACSAAVSEETER